MSQFTALPDGRVQIAWIEHSVDLATATTYAGWLQAGAREAINSQVRDGLLKSAAELRGVIRDAEGNRSKARREWAFQFVNIHGGAA